MRSHLNTAIRLKSGSHYFLFVVFKNLRPARVLNCNPAIIPVQVSKNKCSIVVRCDFGKLWRCQKQKHFSLWSLTELDSRGHFQNIVLSFRLRSLYLDENI